MAESFTMVIMNNTNTSYKKFISSTVDFHDFKNAVKIANELNCGIEISRFGKLRELDDNFNTTLKEYKAILSDFDGEINLHGFFSNLSVASKDPMIREISRKRYYQSFEIACELGAKTVIFHTCLNNLLKYKDYNNMFFVGNIEFFKEFIVNFEKEGIVATMENVHESKPDFIRNLLGAINSPNFKATIDIGHINLHSDMNPGDWIKSYGIMLHHLHLHNNFTNEDSHSSLLDGSVDFVQVFKTLSEIQLKPLIVFEIFDENALRESVQYFDEVLQNL